MSGGRGVDPAPGDYARHQDRRREETLMGTIYRPKFRDRHGVIQESAVWWVRFRQHGKTVRQSTETTDSKKAEKFLHEREGKVALNIPVVPKADRLTLGEAAALIRQDYTANG